MLENGVAGNIKVRVFNNYKSVFICYIDGRNVFSNLAGFFFYFCFVFVLEGLEIILVSERRVGVRDRKDIF